MTIALLIAFILQTSESKADVMYVEFEGSGPTARCSLLREDRAGKELGAVEMKEGDLLERLRATPTGTALGASAHGVIEIDRSGKTIWEFRPPKPWDRPGDARRLENGNTLIGATIKGRYVVFEVDPKRRVLRQVEVNLKGHLHPEAPMIRAAHAIDKDRLLVAGSQGFVEIDWKGRKLFEMAADKAGLCYDVIPLKGGTYLPVRRLPPGPSRITAGRMTGYRMPALHSESRARPGTGDRGRTGDRGPGTDRRPRTGDLFQGPAYGMVVSTLWDQGFPSTAPSIRMTYRPGTAPLRSSIRLAV